MHRLIKDSDGQWDISIGKSVFDATSSAIMTTGFPHMAVKARSHVPLALMGPPSGNVSVG
jgi:hypothetical protein